MRGPSSQARLVQVDHSYLSVDLGVPEAAGSADTKLVSPTEKPPDPFPEMLADCFVGLACVAEAEVLGPAQEKAVEPVPQFGPPNEMSERGVSRFAWAFSSSARWIFQPGEWRALVDEKLTR
jgi:hypothetical protein